MTTVAIPELGSLTDDEIAQLWHAHGGELDLAAITAELDHRQAAEQRRDRARAAARVRNAEWEAAAYAQYQAASDYCNGDHNMLSEAGRRKGRDAWPMCWEGSAETAHELASDELITFWDYVSPRVPGPGQYAAAKRAAAAEHAARAEQSAESAPSSPPVPDYRPRPSLPVPDYRPAAARPPGSIAHLIHAYGALERQAIRTNRALKATQSHQ